jgi:hypothetical protein
MTGFMESLAITAIAVALAAFVLFIAMVALRMARSDQRPLLLGRMLARQGLASVDWGPLGRSAALGTAVRRCLSCPVTETCERWLESGGSEGCADFCPNADFIARLREETGAEKRRAVL